MNLDLHSQTFHKYGLQLTPHLCMSQNESAGKIYHVSTADKGEGDSVAPVWVSSCFKCLLRHLKEFTLLPSEHLACKLANHDSSFFDCTVLAESRHVGNPEAWTQQDQCWLQHLGLCLLCLPTADGLSSLSQNASTHPLQCTAHSRKKFPLASCTALFPNLTALYELRMSHLANDLVPHYTQNYIRIISAKMKKTPQVFLGKPLEIRL